MKPSIVPFSRESILVLAFLVSASSAWAQQPPVVPNPQAPTLAQPFPMGMQRGTTLDLNLTGTNLADPTGMLLGFPAKVTIPTENNNGKDNAKLLVRLEVPKDAPMGWHTMRVATARGVSNFRLFCIDDLPQVLETNDNHTFSSAELVPVPVVICGRCDAEQTDFFRFTVQPGQRLSFELLGRRLGTPLDAMLTLLNPRTGGQLAFSDDAPGIGKDPRLTYTFKEAGEHVIEVRDVRHQGGADWNYRLRIGDFPCATTPVPLAAKRGSTVQVSFAGPHVEGVPPIVVAVPSTPDVEVIWLTPAWPNLPPGWPVALTVTDLDESLEIEPNEDPTKATNITAPGAVNARLQKKGDRDHFVFAAKKGQRYLIEAQTQELQSPTGVYLVLKNAMGAQVAASNPAMDPARIDFTAADDGAFTLAVEHLFYSGGPDETYRITIVPYEPGFTLTALLDRFDVPQGSLAIINVQAVRRDYPGPIEVTVTGTPGITGAVTIPAGQTAALLALNAAADAPLAPHRLTVQGKATINNKAVVESANVQTLVSQNLANLPHPPGHLKRDLAVAIVEKPPFTILAKYDLPEGLRGGSVPVTITATKSAGFDEEITIASIVLPPAAGQPPTVPPATVKIPKGQTQAKVELKPTATAPLGELPLGFKGQTKFNSKDYTSTAPLTPLVLALPFDLQVNTAGGQISPAGSPGPRTVSPLHLFDLLAGQPQPVIFGTLDLEFLQPALGKLKIKVTAVRKGGYKGPIALEVRNLPANITAPKLTIAENQNEIDIELAAAPTATLGAKADVNILGTAAALANQQNASANFSLNVVKK